MGAVYRARNRVTGQQRALKVVRAALSTQREFIDRFIREATVASQLRHPNLVETLEPGIDGETVYLPMELLEGETLSQRLKKVQRMPLADAAALIVPIAEAVQLLHDRGVIHRDLKPQNVILARQPDGREIPKVIDFGTARDVEDDEHTRTGMVIGSPYYMAVEQAEGRRDIDGRADQYALGVIAYQMVTGARPYESDDTRSALAKLLSGEPYLPPSRVYAGVPREVELVITRALERDRNKRFPRIEEFGRAFAAACGVATLAGAPPSSRAALQPAATTVPGPIISASVGFERGATALPGGPSAGSAPTGGPLAPVGGGGLPPPPGATPVQASGATPLPVAGGGGMSSPFLPPPAASAAQPTGPGGRARLVVVAVTAFVLVGAVVIGGSALWVGRRDAITVTRLPDPAAASAVPAVPTIPAAPLGDDSPLPAAVPTPPAVPEPAAAVPTPPADLDSAAPVEPTPAPGSAPVAAPAPHLEQAAPVAAPASPAAPSVAAPAPPREQTAPREFAALRPVATPPQEAVSARTAERTTGTAEPLREPLTHQASVRPPTTDGPSASRPSPGLPSATPPPRRREQSVDAPCGAAIGIPCLD